MARLVYTLAHPKCDQRSLGYEAAELCEAEVVARQHIGSLRPWMFEAVMRGHPFHLVRP